MADKRRLMAIRVKICGLNSVEAADAAARAGADFAGLVFFPRSPRCVSLDQARTLSARLKGGPRLVALFADAEDDVMAEAVEAAAPDLIQLHGGETPARVGEVASRFSLPVIKAIQISGHEDVARARAYEDVADFLLFDAKAPGTLCAPFPKGAARRRCRQSENRTPDGATPPGGHGVAFDWKILSGLSFKRPWLLAGGLTADNVGRAVQASGATMVDTSSGVEDAPGRKSPDKIAAFVRAARKAQFTSVA